MCAVGIAEKLLQNAIPLCGSFGFLLGTTSVVLLLFPTAVLFSLCLCVALLVYAVRFRAINPLVLPWIPAFARALMWLWIGLMSALLCLCRIGSFYASETLAMSAQQIHSFTGVLVSDALKAQHGKRAIIHITSCTDADGTQLGASGRVLVFFDTQESYHAGDYIAATCQGVGFKQVDALSWGWIASASIDDYRKARSVAGVRARILDRLETSLAGMDPGLSGFIFALLLGRQDELDPDMQTAFYRSGCAHLDSLLLK